jgi:nucleoside-diphosphate-sugar epimerase
MKKILLVGGSGFLGSHLCADLEKNHLVTISGTKEKKKLNYVLIDYCCFFNLYNYWNG